jgi:hypothetical protein
LTVARPACSLGYMTEQETRGAVEAELLQWAQDRQRFTEGRDSLVRAARQAGISKHRIYVLTGIARTTIDSILENSTGEKS